MNDLIKIFNDNSIYFSFSNYAGYKSIVIKKNGYKLEIFKDDQGFVTDLQKIPYTWGRMGSATVDSILLDLKNFLNINISTCQLTLF